MANKDTRRCSVWLVIMEMQIKSMRYHSKPTECLQTGNKIEISQVSLKIYRNEAPHYR